MIIFKLGDVRFRYYWDKDWHMWVVDAFDEMGWPVAHHMYSPEMIRYLFECIEWVAKHSNVKMSDYIKSVNDMEGLYIG